MRRATEQGLNMGWTRYKYTTIVKPDCCNSRASFITASLLFYSVKPGSSGHTISGATDVSTRFSNTRYFFQVVTRLTFVH